MSTIRISAVALFVSAALTAAAASGQQPIPPAPISQEAHPLPQNLAPPKLTHLPVAEAPDEDAELLQSLPSTSSGPLRAGVTAAAIGTNLTPPVTITYSGSSNAVTINDTGTSRGLFSSLTNTGNGGSAVYGETKGGGAGVKGINSGVTGSGGVFSINNAASSKPALTAATNGSGYAISAAVTKLNSGQPAIYASNTVSANIGIGVQGVSNSIALVGISNGTSGNGYGVFGYAVSGAAGVDGVSSSGIGVSGQSATSYGVSGNSSTSAGVYGYSLSSNGVYAIAYSGDALSANSTYGRGITVHSVHSLGIYSSSDLSYGVWGQSLNQYGVIGEDSGSGVGVYGSSATGYAGYFAGKVAATSYLTVSDRNAKTDFAPVDGSQLLDRVVRLPITSWSFKDDRKLRHIGPMAQDFHAAFGLNGDDDKHISLADAAGISLAAIQELNRRLQEKDARIAALERLNDAFAARLAKLEERVATAPQIMTAYAPGGAVADRKR